MARRRYQFWYERGRIPPGELLEESDMPEEWIAAHYEWGEPVGEQPYESEGEYEAWSPSEPSGIGILESDGTVVPHVDHGPPPVVTEEPDSSNDRLGEDHRAEPKAKSSGKCGGKGSKEINPKDPPCEDDFDGHI